MHGSRQKIFQNTDGHTLQGFIQAEATFYNVSPESKGPPSVTTGRFQRKTSDEGIAIGSNPVSPTDGDTGLKTKTKSVVFTPPDFDVLFTNPAKLHFAIAGQESIDEGIHSFDSGTSHVPLSSPADMYSISSPTQKPPMQRRDSVMDLTFSEMLIKHWRNSQGLVGFRHKVANDINHKYCSYCRCDEMIFVFLYVLFGITYMCAGFLGLTQCSSELYINIFLITDGALSVFVFPITIMEWTKRIGGCIKKTDIQGYGITFAVIVIMRLAAAVIGSVVMAMRINVYPQDDLMCLTSFVLLEVGVVLEWAFLLFVLLLPLLLYTVAYCVAHIL
ncbi:uncharacterized protein LOC132734015 isoform X1 [Ruditapes philippinarum]|uniref:uncharacterized protein LOC132734015 isoform X1 n=1 Tax=Ruditapes philippinarum TaxID=129788 RepID=UPI00295AA631|nr:uncharacterized protein LOC132734015 isoform X1 [Ruditapes philippinarum]